MKGSNPRALQSGVTGCTETHLSYPGLHWTDSHETAVQKRLGPTFPGVQESPEKASLFGWAMTLPGPRVSGAPLGGSEPCLSLPAPNNHSLDASFLGKGWGDGGKEAGTPTQAGQTINKGAEGRDENNGQSQKRGEKGFVLVSMATARTKGGVRGSCILSLSFHSSSPTPWIYCWQGSFGRAVEAGSMGWTSSFPVSLYPHATGWETYTITVCWRK